MKYCNVCMSGGKVWTVGCNDRSQLGHHNLQDQIELCMVPGVFNIKDIAVGAGHSLVVTKMSQVGDRLRSIICLPMK